MADGELVLKLDEDLAQKLQDGATAAGMSPEAFAQHLLEQRLFNYDDYIWDRDPRETPTVNVEEPSYPMEEVMAEFRAELERRLAKRS